MRVVVDSNRCRANALCMSTVPEVFDVPEDFAVVVDEHPPETIRRRVELAVRRCPTQAISIED
jgi:ferredoxin